MPPKLNENYFDFEGELPFEFEHEFTPGGSGYDPAKFRLGSQDGFDGGGSILAVDIDTLSDAEFLRSAHERQVERNQPAESSGGQRGMQDRTYIIPPSPPN